MAPAALAGALSHLLELDTHPGVLRLLRPALERDVNGVVSTMMVDALVVPTMPVG